LANNFLLWVRLNFDIQMSSLDKDKAEKEREMILEARMNAEK
jgi:hypothetical protein